MYPMPNRSHPDPTGHARRHGGIPGKTEDGHQNYVGRQCHQTRQALAKIRGDPKAVKYLARHLANLTQQWEAALYEDRRPYLL